MTDGQSEAQEYIDTWPGFRPLEEISPTERPSTEMDYVSAERQAEFLRRHQRTIDGQDESGER